MLIATWFKAEEVYGGLGEVYGLSNSLIRYPYSCDFAVKIMLGFRTQTYNTRSILLICGQKHRYEILLFVVDKLWFSKRSIMKISLLVYSVVVSWDLKLAISRSCLGSDDCPVPLLWVRLFWYYLWFTTVCFLIKTIGKSLLWALGSLWLGWHDRGVRNAGVSSCNIPLNLVFVAL